MIWDVSGHFRGRLQHAKVRADDEQGAREYAEARGMSVARVERFDKPISLDELSKLDNPDAGLLWCAECGQFSFGAIFSKDRLCGKCTRKKEAAKAAEVSARLAAAAAARRAELARQDSLVRECAAAVLNIIGTPGWPQRVGQVLRRFEGNGVQDAAVLRRKVYDAFLGRLSAHAYPGVDDDSAMTAVRESLGLQPAEAERLNAAFLRQRCFEALADGRLPTIPDPGIILQRNEVARFTFYPVEFYQERVVSRHYEGSTSGVSLRIARGVTYRVGASRGQLVSRTGNVHLGTGTVVLTSKRLVFSGPSAFSIPLAKILHATAYSDGISVVKDSTAQNNRPFILLYPDGEMLNAAFSACINFAG